MMTPLRRIALGVLAGVLMMALIGYLAWPRFVEHGVDYRMPGNPRPKIVAAQVAAIERREQIVDQTVWVKEIEAQEYGRVFEDFWDALNAATNKWAVVDGLRFEEAVLGEWKKNESLPHGIESWQKIPESAVVESYRRWREKVSNWKQEGWEIAQCEFRHNRFNPQTADSPAQSKLYFSAHLTNALPARAIVEGDLFVHWARRETNQTPSIGQIGASSLQIMFRAGPPAFVPILTETFDPPPLSHALEPLLVYDLDFDGIPEIALPAANRLYRWRGDHYESEKFCSTPRMQVWDGLFADIDGDGIADFLYVESDYIFLLKGLPGGRFATLPRALISKQEDFFGAHALTCGDIDNDGDLDVFVGQYKLPYTGGSMPTPYYDANDGYPSHLYLNDGAGNLRDATIEAGLGPKRFRRVYSASFADLNSDGALDLVVTSDFAGVDIYRNDGLGHFTDVTSSWLDESHLFGMGHTFGDFNNDGRLDFYVSGMQSPTAERLEHLGLNRPSSKLDVTMRARMIVGSRLYFGQENTRFKEAGKSPARTGWSWGASGADFDNDGWLDLYVVNGMESMDKVHDYDPQFWLHDIFVGDSQQKEVENMYFGMKMIARRRALESYGGFEKNRLLLNQSGTNFVNVAHLLGVALEDDCRNLVAADLDADGRIDLAMTSQHAVPISKEKLRVFRNKIAEQGNWIAFSFREEPGHISPIGATVTVRGGGFQKVTAVVTGGSFRSQHPLTARFGLGSADRVEIVEIRWPGGALTRLAGPEINQAHRLSAPKS
jgi:hypothetical protein